jgi:hypothetical protein
MPESAINFRLLKLIQVCLCGGLADILLDFIR